MFFNVRGLWFTFHAASPIMTEQDSTRARVAVPNLKAADKGKHAPPVKIQFPTGRKLGAGTADFFPTGRKL
jgi:hypothetical protein